MADNYRIKYKAGDFEVEVESTDKSFVEMKLKELTQEEGNSPAAKPHKKVATKKTTSPKRNAPTEEGNGDSVDIVSIVNAINDSDQHSIIEQKILKKSNQLNRILLAFYFTTQVNSSLSITTGDVEKITHQLGIRIKSNNVSRTIKENPKYFAADTVRKQGAVMKFKINRKGIEQFESIMAS